MHTRELIDEFLRQKRIAMIGVSRNPKDFSRNLYRELLRRRYEVIPINPSAQEIDGHPCYPHISDIRPPIKTLLLMTSRKVSTAVLRECADRGADLVWLYGINGEQDVDPAALQFCRDHGIGVIPGYCPYMFLERAAFFHRIHGFVAKLVGKYPQHHRPA